MARGPLQNELWGKLSNQLVTSLYSQRYSNNIEVLKGNIVVPNLKKHHIMLLAKIMISKESIGTMRDSAIMNHLFKCV